MLFRSVFAVLVAFTAQLVGFEDTPWFPYPYEFHFRPSYFGSYYPDVDGAINPSDYHSWNQIFGANLGVNTLSQFDSQVELEMMNTSHTTFTLLSAGLQGRYLLMDDIQGDVVSLYLGANARFVPDHARRDPTCPYHALFNFEVLTGVGREFDFQEEWVFRLHGVLAAGLGTEGSPWLKGSAIFDINGRYNKNQCALIADSYWGFGPERFVNINGFSGYEHTWHQSIDLSAQYKRVFDIWGTFSCGAGYRVWAKDFPENQIFIEVKYDLPFSLF